MLSRAGYLFVLLLHFSGSAWAEDYLIGPEDVLQIQVWSRPDLSTTVSVSASGDIRLPLLGTVPVEGSTPEALGVDLVRRYSILDARISEVIVNVLEYRSRSVSIVGEVISPGRLSFQTIPNLWEILLAAGGATDKADLARVQIVRKEKLEGEPPTITVDLSAGLERTDLSTMPEVRPRDTILVPSRGGEGVTGDSFQVLGMVANPGFYQLSAASSVVEALAVSGGPVATADLSKISLTRHSTSGVAAFELDLNGHLKRGKPLADFPLKKGDTILVPQKEQVDAMYMVTRLIGLTSAITAITSLIIVIQD